MRHEYDLTIEDGCVTNGCALADDVSLEVFDEMQNFAVSLSTLWTTPGDMPVVKFDDEFKKWRQTQIDACNEIRDNRLSCLLPWEILKALPAERKASNSLYFSQGGLGSCMGHADSFAYHSALLHDIGRGASHIYDPFNPVVTWAITKGGSLRGGQSVSEMSKGANQLGHYTQQLVGADNQRMPSNYKNYTEAAKKHQSGLVFLNFRGKELADEIIQTCAAGFGIAIGNGTAVNGSTQDSNGVKIPTLRGSWAHATSFIGYRIVKRVEYVGWVNSHGGRYPSSDEGEPADMCWMPRSIVESFVATASGYGPPYAVFHKGEYGRDTSLMPMRVPYPANWRW